MQRMSGNLRVSKPWRLLPPSLLGALILGWPAYWNGYPLVFGDTGNYIGQIKLRFIGWTAPPFYSAFLSTTDLGLSLWGPMLAQALIAAGLVAIALDQFGLRRWWGAPVACAALAVFTSLPWLASQVTADFFTGIAVLSLALLGFGSLARWQRVIVFLVALLAVLAHQSHVPLAFGLLGVGCLVRWAQAGRTAAGEACRRLAPVPVLAAAIAFAVNTVGLGLPALSPYGNIILAARMLADGTANAYLRDACPTESYKLCDHLAEIGPGGTTMLWDRPAMWDAIGGHRAWNAEAGRIVRGTIAHDPAGVLAALLDNGVQQFAALRTGESLQPWARDDGPRPLIARFFLHELAAFDASRQQRGLLLQDVAPWEAVHVPIAWLGIAGLLACLWAFRRDPVACGLCAMVLAATIGNALLTGGLSEVQNRYAARLAWVLSFTPCLVLAARLRAAPAAGIPRLHRRCRKPLRRLIPVSMNADRYGGSLAHSRHTNPARLIPACKSQEFCRLVSDPLGHHHPPLLRRHRAGRHQGAEILHRLHQHHPGEAREKPRAEPFPGAGAAQQQPGAEGRDVQRRLPPLHLEHLPPQQPGDLAAGIGLAMAEGGAFQMRPEPEPVRHHHDEAAIVLQHPPGLAQHAPGVLGGLQAVHQQDAVEHQVGEGQAILLRDGGAGGRAARPAPAWQLWRHRGDAARGLRFPQPQEGAGIAEAEHRHAPRAGPEGAQPVAQQARRHQPRRRGVEILQAVDLVAHAMDIERRGPPLQRGRRRSPSCHSRSPPCRVFPTTICGCCRTARPARWRSATRARPARPWRRWSNSAAGST